MALLRGYEENIAQTITPDMKLYEKKDMASA